MTSYTDPKTSKVHFKVGRTVNLVKRIDQWGKRCASKEQVLRGWWPGTVEDDDDEDQAINGSLMKGRVRAGDKGPLCHRLERLVHLELADLAVNAPYLEPGFPKTKKKDAGGGSTSSSSKKPPASPAGKKLLDKPCPDCTCLSFLSLPLFIYLSICDFRWIELYCTGRWLYTQGDIFSDACRKREV